MTANLSGSIDSLDDPRLDPYRDLKHRGEKPEALIAEGEKLVRRMLASSCRVESILCTVAAHERLKSLLKPDTCAYIAPTALISRLIGFRFHRGVLACGARPKNADLESLCRALPVQRPALLVLCPELRDPTNLGTIIRTAVAFGASGLVLGQSGVDPYSRRVLRTSMGAVFRIPIVQTDDWNSVLDLLHGGGFDSVAAILDPTAERLDEMPHSGRVALLFGNEDQGLPAAITERCTRRVVLSMSSEIDSLNVAVAAGIILHHFSVAGSHRDAKM